MQTLNKILIHIQGHTLILQYRVRSPSAGISPYIEVLPSAELAKFDLKGLNPETFCVNLADTVNLKGRYSGQIENEKQLPVAKWSVDHEELKLALSSASPKLTFDQAARRLAEIPGFVARHGQYFDFESTSSFSLDGGTSTMCGYRLTVILEEIDRKPEAQTYFYLHILNGTDWMELSPPPNVASALKETINKKLYEIRSAGIQINSISDETDYSPEQNSGLIELPRA